MDEAGAWAKRGEGCAGECRVLLSSSCGLYFELIADGDQLVHLGDDAFLFGERGDPEAEGADPGSVKVELG